MNSIKPIHLDRQRRSLDILGTTWKYLDGYPDHNDLEMITKALGDLSENSYNQFVINRDFKEQTNKIINTTNIIANDIKQNNFLIDEIVNLCQNKLRLLKEELINV